NNALGKNNDLIWHLPDDFKRFKEMTSGLYIIMGRKTFESFPKPLPNRTHGVITRQSDYECDGCIVVNDLTSAMGSVPGNQNVLMIGGADIYARSLGFADKIEFRRVHVSVPAADAVFPKVGLAPGDLGNEDCPPADGHHSYAFAYQT